MRSNNSFWRCTAHRCCRPWSGWAHPTNHRVGAPDSGYECRLADGERVLAATAANPLPQALVLTAIVIGFAFVCFALVLVAALLAKRPEGDVEALVDAEPGPGADGKPQPFDAERRA